MGILMVPGPDDEPYPTLGPWVCQFIEENLVHGPGDLFGQPVKLTDEDRGWFWKMYEVEPLYLRKRGRPKNPRAGKRRFERCVLSLRKGSAKTEKAAWIAAVELHPDGPVRCGGFLKNGEIDPMAVHGVTDPYIPMISYTEEQTEELAYGALRRILEESSLAGDFDIGLQRIMRRRGDGKAEAVSTSPNARDGARTTFQHCDESHRLVLDGQKRAWAVMLANLGKRPLAEPWALETTTAPEPGGGSVAEATMEYARKLEGDPEKARASRLFFYHREASDHHDVTTPKGLRAAIIEASGPYIVKWSDPDRIARLFEADDADKPYLQRVWLNRCIQAADKAFDVAVWAGLYRAGYTVPNRAAISLGFDGSRFEDSTALVGTELETGYQFVLGCWEKPDNEAAWEVAVADVDATVDDAFARWTVTRMYCDPPKWESWVATWAGRYGDKRVVEWWTNRRKPMAYAIRSYVGAIATGELAHDGDNRFKQHIGNACRADTNLVDEKDKPLWIIRKERPDSPWKIDLAMGALLSWEARNDSIAAGEGKAKRYDMLFVGGR